MYDVVTIGDIYQDVFLLPQKAAILDSPKFFSGKGLCFGYGEKVPLDSISYFIGGSAANSAMNFSKIGLKSAIVSSVGGDDGGEKILEYFLKNQVDTSSIKQKKSDASNMSIIILYNGERTIFTYHGDRLVEDFMPKKSLKTRWFYLAPVGCDSSKLENKIIETIAKNGSGLVWNPGNFQIKKGARNFRHILRLTNIIFINKDELTEFVDQPGKSETHDMMKQLALYGVKIVVVTNGKKGAICYDGSLFYQIGASEDKRVDATGAGDAFASSFSANIILSSNGKPQGYQPDRETIEKSLKWGIIVSGSVVSQLGAHEGILSRSEIEENGKKLFKLNSRVYTR